MYLVYLIIKSLLHINKTELMHFINLAFMTVTLLFTSRQVIAITATTIPATIINYYNLPYNQTGAYKVFKLIKW